MSRLSKSKQLLFSFRGYCIENLLPMTLLGFISCDEISCDVVEVVAMLLLVVYNFSFEIGDFSQIFLRETELRICIISLMNIRWEAITAVTLADSRWE